MIKESIELERRKREESTTLLTEEIESELNKFHDVLLIEKKVIKLFRIYDCIGLKLLFLI